jgi:hypothetical protein
MISSKHLLLWVGITCWYPTSTTIAAQRIFSSRNGFDAGGAEPVCWEALMDNTAVEAILAGQESTSSSNMSGVAVENSPPQVVQLNEFIVDVSVASSFHVLPSCYPGTKLAITENKVRTGGWSVNSWTTGNHRTFQLDMETQVQNILGSGGGGGTNGTTTTNINTNQEPLEVRMRLILCKATEVGTCSPFFDVVNASSGAVVDQVVRSVDYKEGQVLQGVKFGTSHVSTPWITSYLTPDEKQEQNNNNNNDEGSTLKGSVTISLRLDKGMEGIYFMVGHAILFVSDGGPNSIRVSLSLLLWLWLLVLLWRAQV